MKIGDVFTDGKRTLIVTGHNDAGYIAEVYTPKTEVLKEEVTTPKRRRKTEV